jgi:hypothetical protein
VAWTFPARRNDCGRFDRSATTAPPTPDSEYGSLLRDFTIDDFHKDPAYDFTLSEGQKALDRSAAAKGVLGSGTYLKDLTKYNQDYRQHEIRRVLQPLQQ